MIMFDRYSRGGKSLQVLSKGLYWAGKAAMAARRTTDAYDVFSARRYLIRSCSTASLRSSSSDARFRRRGRYRPSRSIRRSGSNSATRRLVQATQITRSARPAVGTNPVRPGARRIAEQRRRACRLQRSSASKSAATDVGVWVLRMARVKGSAFYVETAYPRLPGVRATAPGCGR